MTRLDKEQIISFVYENLDFFEEKDSLVAQEIGDGNINYVYKIFDKNSGKSLVLKRSDELLRSSGRPLDIKRSSVEARSLQLKNKLAKGFCPEIYLFDEEKALIVMEDLSAYKNLRTELLEKRLYESLPDQISDFLAKSLLPTTDLVLSRRKKKELARDFTNPDMCDISEDLVFTEPYYNYKDRNNISPGLEDFVKEKLYENEELIKKVLILKDKFQNQSQALLHGDLHTGSIFVNEEGIKVIDSEFAFYGPMGYDYGNVWANLSFPLVRAYVLKEDRAYIEKLEDQLIRTLDLSIEKLYKAYDYYISFPYFKNEGFKRYYLKEIIADSFSYAGCELIRRSVGDSSVPDLTSIKDLEKRRDADKALVKTGIDLIIKGESLRSGEDILKIIHKYLA